MKKWQKNLLWVFLGLSVLVLGVLLYMIFIFEMFPVHEELLLTVAVPNKDYKISAYYVDGGATSSGAILLRKVHASGKSEILKDIPVYQDVKAMEILSAKKMRVIVGFKNGFSTKTDTVLVEIE